MNFTGVINTFLSYLKDFNCKLKYRNMYAIEGGWRMEINWIQLMFWPFMVALIIISLIGIYFRKSSLLMISAILIIPLSLYLVGSPRFSVWGLLFPFLYIGAAQSMKKQKVWLSILFSIPVYFLIGWLGYTVLTQ